MKIFVKTLKGNHFDVEVKPQDTVADVKKNIETVKGADVYPASQQMLIHQGKVLKDDTTLEENKVAEKSFIVVMMTKSKSSSGEGSAAAAPTPVSKAPPSMASPASVQESATPLTPLTNALLPTTVPVSAPAPAPVPAPVILPAGPPSEQAASNLLVVSNLEPAIEHILDMGGGTWDRDTVVCALRAAYNNPERAVEYLYSGIPEQTEVPPVTQSTGVGQLTDALSSAQQPTQPAAVLSSDPNANPLNLFPQGLPNLGSGAGTTGALDFLRNSEQFQALRSMVQTNPQILQPMLQELGKQNPNLVRLIQEHQADFLQLMNEPVEGEEGNILGQFDAAMPQAIQVTPEEHEAIQRLEAMGFDRATVLEVYFACNKNEELTANYLLDHMHELED